MTSIQCNVEFRYKFTTIPGLQNTTERLDRVNRSHDLPDAYPISRQQVVVRVHETNGRPYACSFCNFKTTQICFTDLFSVTLCSRHGTLTADKDRTVNVTS